MILLISLYVDMNVPRCQEFMECVRRNAANPCIDQLHVFVEMPPNSHLAGLLSSFPQLGSPKVKLIHFGRRATYQDLFFYANADLRGQRVIIANTDIYFDATLAQLEGYGLNRKLIALSRWDITPEGDARFFDHPMSQDAWIFDTPLCDFPCNFYFGVPGCDNRLAWEASRAGLTLINPSRSIRAYHLHLTGVRRYSERQRVAGPTASVPATFMESSYQDSCAVVAFRERMGYTIGRLEEGASSHNNDARPFTAIPEILAGLAYTQVVACSVSEVEVEFLASGKLYVLVGTDWEGGGIATAWLRKEARRELIPPLMTHRRTSFEVWSLVAEAGHRVVLPTQVMLVASHLEKR